MTEQEESRWLAKWINVRIPFVIYLLPKSFKDLKMKLEIDGGPIFFSSDQV